MSIVLERDILYKIKYIPTINQSVNRGGYEIIKIFLEYSKKSETFIEYSKKI